MFTNADFSSATDTLTEGLEKIVLDGPEATVAEGDRLADVRALYASLVGRQRSTARSSPTISMTISTRRALGDYRRAWRRSVRRPSIEIRAHHGCAAASSTATTGCIIRAADLKLITYAEPGAAGRWEQFMIMP